MSSKMQIACVDHSLGEIIMVFENVLPSFRDMLKAISLAKRNDCHNDSALSRHFIFFPNLKFADGSDFEGTLCSGPCPCLSQL